MRSMTQKNKIVGVFAKQYLLVRHLIVGFGLLWLLRKMWSNSSFILKRQLKFSVMGL